MKVVEILNESLLDKIRSALGTVKGKSCSINVIIAKSISSFAVHISDDETLE